MRAAPAVSVRCSGGKAWHASCVLLQALAAAAFSAWALQQLECHPAWATFPGLMVAAWGWAWMRQPAVQLVFDGQGWAADGQSGQPELMIDLGRLMLLRWWPAQGRRPRWLPCTASEVGPAWHGLRVAVHHSGVPGEDRSGIPQPARD